MKIDRLGIALMISVGMIMSFFSPGCAPSQPFVTPARLDKGLILVLTGIEGRSKLNEDICWGLADSGIEQAIELVDWTVHVPGAYLFNLRNEARNREKAGQIADRIERYQATHPSRPVFLVGHSGGGAMAIWIAEALQPNSKIDGIILLSASISPDYLLDPALLHCKRGIVSFYSPKDWVFLGVGTAAWGTMDGEHTPSAGMVGFNVPAEPAEAGLYHKLYQIPWREEMEMTGFAGTHLTSAARRFIARYVSPLIMAEKWDKSTIQAILSNNPHTVIPPAKDNASP